MLQKKYNTAMTNKFNDLILQATQSDNRLRKILLGLILLSIVVIVAMNLSYEWRTLQDPYIYIKDFMQEYLMARAVLSGENPYTPLPDLVVRFFGELSMGDGLVPILTNVSPHPPPVSILFLPFGMLPYQSACVLWYFIEIALVVASVCLILKSLTSRPVGFRFVLVLALLFLAWNPFHVDLVFGQLSILNLFLLSLAWYKLSNEKLVPAGIWLGLSISIKLIAWPLVVWLIFIKRYKAAVSAILTFIVLNLLAALVISPQAVVQYYRVVGSQVYLQYGPSAANFSITGLLWRVFSGTSAEAIEGIRALPLLHLPALPNILAPIIILAALLLILLLPICRRDQRAGFIIVLTFCVLASPVTWNHYFVLLSLPLAFAYYRIAVAPTTKPWLMTALIMTSFVLAIPVSIYSLLTAKITGVDPAELSVITVPFWIGMISYLPALSSMVLNWLVIRIGELNQSQ